MSVAPSSESALNPSFSQPKQAKLLGATVKGVGVITTVSAHPGSMYVLIEDGEGFEHHRFVSTLEPHELILPPEVQPYRHYTRRISYDVWDKVNGSKFV